MSGPKVVRIVTREEILEICNGQLARVDAALADWVRICRRNECLDDAALAQARQRRTALEALLAQDRFIEVQKAAPDEEDFLRRDLQDRLAQAAARAVAARRQERRGRDVGASLLRALQAAGTPLDSALERGLLSGKEAALSAGFDLMASRVPAAKAPGDLAAAFREDGGRQSFASWLQAQPAPPADPAIDRLALRLAELAQVLEEDQITGMRARLAEAETAPPARRALLLDGLEVETASSLAEARRCRALLADLRLVRAETLATDLRLENDAKDQTEEALASLGAKELEARLTSAREALEQARAAAAASARRAAVLQGLAVLGYDVAEGMGTVTASDGRLVLRSATRPGYGVELTTAGATGRMQMRPIAFNFAGRGPDPARDRDAETIWCSEVTTLQDLLARDGGRLAIEKAQPIGAAALKRLELSGQFSTTEAAAQAPQTRSRHM